MITIDNINSMISMITYFNCKLSFSEKFLFRSKVQNVESKMNHCLHNDVITLCERGNSDPGKPYFFWG